MQGSFDCSRPGTPCPLEDLQPRDPGPYLGLDPGPSPALHLLGEGGEADRPWWSDDSGKGRGGAPRSSTRPSPRSPPVGSRIVENRPWSAQQTLAC
jgi:hypothetical protein